MIASLVFHINKNHVVCDQVNINNHFVSLNSLVLLPQQSLSQISSYQTIVHLKNNIENVLIKNELNCKISIEYDHGLFSLKIYCSFISKEQAEYFYTLTQVSPISAF